MAPYIHGRRNMIHVIDLRETMRGLIRARNFLSRLVAEGQQILWVGTKRQIKGVISDAGERTGMPTVTERWIGGTLTNFSVIRSRLRRLEELERMEEDGSINQYSKKAIASLRRERRKIHRNLSGIREMNGIPGAMVVIDPGREYNAVREARKMGLAVIGMLDTDCDPAGVDLVIPGNDDALRSVRLVVDSLVESVEEGGAAHRERLAATGPAERSAEGAEESDEPRPTRAQTISRPPKVARPDDASGGADAPGVVADEAPAATKAEEPAVADAPAVDAPKPEGGASEVAAAGEGSAS